MEGISTENLNLPPLSHPAAMLLNSPAVSSSAVQASSQQPDHLRLQHLYTLALADRMRMLQPAFNGGVCNPFAGMFLPGSAASLAAAQAQAHRFNPPSDLARFPLAKLDPRLFRIPFPEEPKPQHSYIGLIAMAILSSSEKKLVLADIYQYILDNFPYFRHRGPGWRNSIRHNLSLNDCFIKAGRASNGKGHFWAVHPACQEDFQKGDFSRRKAQRKVRKYLGMNVGLDDEDTPPSSPIPFQYSSSLPTASPLPGSSQTTSLPSLSPIGVPTQSSPLPSHEDYEEMKPTPFQLHLDQLRMLPNIHQHQLQFQQGYRSPVMPESRSPAASPSSSISPGASPPRSSLFPPTSLSTFSTSLLATSALKSETIPRRNFSFGIDSLLKKDASSQFKYNSSD